MAGPVLLVLLGGLIITQTLFGAMWERLGIKAALVPGSS
jgi:hypothetical protein